MAFTKLLLLQESKLTGGGSPNLVDLVEWKFPVARKMGASKKFSWKQDFFHCMNCSKEIAFASEVFAKDWIFLCCWVGTERN